MEGEKNGEEILIREQLRGRQVALLLEGGTELRPSAGLQPCIAASL